MDSSITLDCSAAARNGRKLQSAKQKLRSVAGDMLCKAWKYTSIMPAFSGFCWNSLEGGGSVRVPG